MSQGFDTIATEQYGEIRLFWIRLLYGCTSFLGITVGSTMLIAPDFSREVVGIPFVLPVQDPIIYGALAGIWTAVGILCLFGQRAPLKWLPLFCLQLVYKSLWFAFVFFPLILRGEFPDYGWASAVGNLMWMLLDIKAIPWKYLFSPDNVRAQLGVEAKEEQTVSNDVRAAA